MRAERRLRATTRRCGASPRAVQAVEPDATEGPISILEARRHRASPPSSRPALWALLSIAILLWITLRRLGDVLLTLIPLLLAGVVTLEICVLVGMPLNFANIIALPLLLGVGVAFKIYYIMAWREGQTNLLQIGADARGDRSARCTTATAFGSLYVLEPSGHVEHGQAAGALAAHARWRRRSLFQPMLMGKPRESEQETQEPSQKKPI